MKDLVNLKGHFKVESLNRNLNVIDEWSEDNLIMETARISMAEMFSLLTTNTGISKFVIGSKGHDPADIRIPKTSSEGFVSTRDRLFSEAIDVIDPDELTVLKGDVVKYTSASNASATQNNYYEYTGAGAILGIVASIDFATNWVDLGAVDPYTYSIAFDLPEVASGSALNIVEDDGVVGSTVTITQTGNEVEFVHYLSISAGNQADDPVAGVSTFTEAAMYMNGRIFCMKTFPAKIKDNASTLRITWTIAF
jgi:hypothetical protein